MKKKSKHEESIINWHRLWGLMITPLFERIGYKTMVEFDVSFKKQIIDVVVVTKQKSEVNYGDVDLSYYEGFENLNEINLISFKSFREVFNESSLEEFYGHLTNYKKINKLNDADKRRINLYVVTNHKPVTLFNAFEGTSFLKTLKKDRIYDLKLLTQVRFIITRMSDHPILGLFSDVPEQVKRSYERLQQDEWLLEEISIYFKKLLEYYYLEGMEMITKEQFIKENYPDYFKGLKEGEKKGKKEGKKEGKASLIIKLFKRRFGEISPELEKEIKSSEAEKLEKLGELIFDFKEYAEVEKWLKVHHN
ncbi:MAG: DUF4351 domain-containing protein [bacterium]